MKSTPLSLLEARVNYLERLVLQQSKQIEELQASSKETWKLVVAYLDQKLGHIKY